MVREGRMWTQGRLAEEAGVSPTTVSGIESGRISRPHFSTIRKLAGALGVEPEELLSGGPGAVAFGVRAAAPLSLSWAVSSREEGLEGAALGGLLALSRELVEEHERLLRFYGETRDREERRLIKGRVREVAARHGSVEVSVSHYPDLSEPSPAEEGERDRVVRGPQGGKGSSR